MHHAWFLLGIRTYIESVRWWIRRAARGNACKLGIGRLAVPVLQAGFVEIVRHRHFVAPTEIEQEEWTTGGLLRRGKRTQQPEQRRGMWKTTLAKCRQLVWTTPIRSCTVCYLCCPAFYSEHSENLRRPLAPHFWSWSHLGLPMLLASCCPSSSSWSAGRAD